MIGIIVSVVGKEDYTCIKSFNSNLTELDLSVRLNLL